MTLYTVGYEGLDIDEFCEALKKNRIELVVDVRKNPVSRKKGFSKRLLAENLQNFKIEYEHLGGLGVPSEWRKQAKEEIITRKKMFRDYVKKILPDHDDELNQIRKLMKKKRLALLCYEADATDCHRSLVSSEILKREGKRLVIKNLQILSSTPGLLSNKNSVSK